MFDPQGTKLGSFIQGFLLIENISIANLFKHLLLVIRGSFHGHFMVIITVILSTRNYDIYIVIFILNESIAMINMIIQRHYISNDLTKYNPRSLP